MSSSVSEAGAAPAPRYPDYRIISLILACAIFMEQMDATVLATALPTLARDFGVAAPAMSIAMTSYLLALAVLIPASGAIADRFGLRRVFSASIWVFVGGSILCSLADSLPTMVAARVLQGAGGAMMAPLGRLILLRTVERRHLVSAMAWTLVPAFIGPMLGPPLGGFFVSYLDWRWIFYINVPIGIAGFLLVRRFIPDIPSESAPARFDLRGFVLCGTALGCLLFGLEMVSQEDGIPRASWLLAIGGATALGYLWHARQHPAPLLDLSLLRIDSFRLSVIGGALMRITQGAHPFLLPLLFQISFGFSAARSGRLILATALGALLMRSITPQLLRRFGYRNSLIGNGVLASLGYMVCALFRPDHAGADVRFAAVLRGVHVVPVCRLQHHRLRKRAGRAHGPRQQPVHHAAAIDAVGRCVCRRDDPQAGDAGGRSPAAAATRFFAGVLRGQPDLAQRHVVARALRQACRAGNERASRLSLRRRGDALHWLSARLSSRDG